MKSADIASEGSTWLDHYFIALSLAVTSVILAGWMTYMGISTIILGLKISQLDNELGSTEQVLIDTYQRLVEEGKPDGYAPLNGMKKVPSAYLPPEKSYQPFSGCWDASNNQPVLQQGVCDETELFVVCVPGSTHLANTTTWNLFDQIICLNGDWIRIDSGRNTITDAGGPPVGTENSIIGDGLGPDFTLNTVKGDSDVIVTPLENGTLLEFSVDRTVPVSNVSDDPLGTGESIIAQGIGPVWEFKSVVHNENVAITEESNVLLLDVPAGKIVDSGFTEINITTFNFQQPSGYVRMAWHYLDGVVRLMTVSTIKLTMTNHTEGDGRISIFLDEADESVIKNAIPGPDGVGGVATSYKITAASTDSQYAFAGYCFRNNVNVHRVDCDIARTRINHVSTLFPFQAHYGFDITFFDTQY